MLRHPFIALPLLLMLSLALGACSHDRYLFLERADLSAIERELIEQRAELNALQTRTAQQFDLLETRQQLRHSELQEQFAAQRVRLEQLAKSAPPPGVRLHDSLTMAPGQRSARYQGKMIVGEVEPLYLAIPGLVYEARIDSGATTSSLHATGIQRFERDGERWVRFDILDPASGNRVTLERELSRTARILQSGSEDAERRAVVELPFVIGDHRQSAEFTLTDRSHLTYPILIGRNVLRDVMLIDVGREHLTRLPDSLGRREESQP